METVSAKIEDYTVSTSDKLRNMTVSKKQALEIPAADSASVRSLISRLHQENKSIKYITTKTDTGILVWRVK
jgi:hypothetical protein